MDKAGKVWISKAYIPDPLKGTVLIVDIQNRKIRRKPLVRRAMRIENFTGVVYGFSNEFLKELREVAVK